MMKKYSRICARVDLDAIEYNIEMMRKNIKEDTKMMAVLKTDGYGHGAVQIARVLEDKDYIWGYAVATLDEAIRLRRGCMSKPILVLGVVFPDQWPELISNDVRMTVYKEEAIKIVSEMAKVMNKKVYVHIKLDTGMGRLGFPITEESVDIIERISKLPNIVMEGMYTHFAKADEIDKTFTEKQLRDYLWMKEELLERGIKFEYYHCSNSAGIIDHPEANKDMVRAGISTYGLYPSQEVKKENVPLKPALELIGHVAYVKWVEAGTPISYGGTYVTERRTKIATIPLGYGDGYARSLSNKADVLIRGKRCRVIGRICMDQFMVDVTDLPDVEYGDKVTLIGYDGEEHIPVEELGDIADRFSYEFICDLGKRIPREFIRHGKVIEQMDYFL